MEILPQSFYLREPCALAQDILGTVFHYGEKQAMIVETEAYCKDDPGSHTYGGRTPRNEIMFGPGGYLYLYLIYGIHILMNITADKAGIPGAVLIRAVKPLNFKGRTNGPGLLTKAMGITMDDYGKSLFSNEIHISPRIMNIDEDTIVRTSRIGIYSGKKRLQRYYLKNCPFISRK